MQQIRQEIRDSVLARMRESGVTLPVTAIHDAGNHVYEVFLYSLKKPMLVDITPMPALTWKDYLKLAWEAFRNGS